MDGLKPPAFGLNAPAFGVNAPAVGLNPPAFGLKAGAEVAAAPPGTNGAEVVDGLKLAVPVLRLPPPGVQEAPVFIFGVKVEAPALMALYQNMVRKCYKKLL